MRAILTHEQADFDALASLLGAALLDDDATPVLPRRMNRNVRAFVALYSPELPFVDPRDLPTVSLEAVTLVDTQSLVTLRGMSQATRVHVIDHHPPRPGLPPDWKVTAETVGATTTLFVEALQEHNGSLSITHATLLLLGIYEDTGSLTYSRTTPRDLQAAAYLLEHGADLRTAINFLNHPITLQQQAIYEQLRANAEHLHVHGHTIVVACGDIQETDEELSTIAHRLRDLLEPDALFVLVKMRGGVQLIARSTSDHIDVAEIAGCFGGGGHDRAAAGLIKGRELADVRAELIRLLPEKVRPAITVAQIMSQRPQVLAPETPAHEAVVRMQRYGYEGYPVVKDNQILGLLTRRAVDRAIAHKMGHITAASLMEAGEISVHPADSLEHLQRLMADSGWGQVPVLHPETDELIGIVTRTDLLKTLTPQPRLPGRLNLAERLETALPAAHLALLKAVAQVAHDQHIAVYVVGGFVRDLLLERPSLDFDIVVEGDAIALAHALARQHGGRVTSHGRFGTAKWRLTDSAWRASDSAHDSPLPAALDLISARTEFYTHPTALPTVERGSIKLDLHRRDFTINTLALRLDGRHYGELHDYWGGLDDLRRGLVRVLHSISFVDDPTRMLRAVRFEQRFGFQIEDRTRQLLAEALPLLGRVSGDRIRHELDHILDEVHISAMLARLKDLGLLPAIHPDLGWDTWLAEKMIAIQAQPITTDWELPAAYGKLPIERALAYGIWVLRLPPAGAQGVIDRLMMPRDLGDHILSAIRLRGELASLVGQMPSTVTFRLDGSAPLALYVNFLAAESPEACELLRAHVTRWKWIAPVITGHDLRARGLPPGPQYQRILSALRRAWLDGEVSTAEQEQTLLESLIFAARNPAP
jgi:tRNA nucleotidyltransferase (CCA-adding enzyme)